ncbi:MAG: hypothetical protein ACP5OR_09090 [Candidatus Dormibacteria bacterium]
MAAKNPIVKVTPAPRTHNAPREQGFEERLMEIEQHIEHSQMLSDFNALSARSKVTFLIASVLGIVTIMVIVTCCLMALFGKAGAIPNLMAGVSPILMFSLGALLTYVFGHSQHTS